MARYLARRLVQAALILVGVTIITFLLTHLVPADPARMVAGRNASLDTVESIRHQLGLDRPLVEQYLRYMGGLLQGDLGRSYIQRIDVAELIAARLPATLALLAGAILCELLIGIPAGLFAATQRGRFADRAIMVAAFSGVSAPQFVVGLLLLYVFAFGLGWFPTRGFNGVDSLVLPAMTLGILGGGWYARMMRSTMVDVLRQDYIRTAWAKGAGGTRVVLVHGLRNGILPIVAMIGLDIGIFMNGVVVVETVFGWPGIGQLAWQAIQRLDVPIIMGVTMVAAVGVVLGNLVADLIAPFVDPRIKLR
ncbi:MAG: ABC transporter permease [Rhodospirillaceae bacterium]|nr:ABC transporter permease [Rhodospirillaceae bacterium]